jgi:peptidoglycan/LPS O-acetylase OafA/YrhL
MNKWQALGNLTTFGWWTRLGGQFNWYIPTLMGLYLFSPLFFQIIRQGGRTALWMFPLFFLLEAACVNTSLMIGVSRFPVYFLGMYLGGQAAQGKEPSRRHQILAGVLAVGSMLGLYYLVQRYPGALSKYGFWWHPFLLSTPGCLYFATWCLQKREQWRWGRKLNQGLTLLGNRSFEIYLCHILVYTVALYFQVQGWGWWILLALGGFALGSLYSGLVTWATAKRKAR